MEIGEFVGCCLILIKIYLINLTLWIVVENDFDPDRDTHWSVVTGALGKIKLSNKGRRNDEDYGRNLSIKKDLEYNYMNYRH